MVTNDSKIVDTIYPLVLLPTKLKFTGWTHRTISHDFFQRCICLKCNFVQTCVNTATVNVATPKHKKKSNVTIVAAFVRISKSRIYKLNITTPFMQYDSCLLLLFNVCCDSSVHVDTMSDSTLMSMFALNFILNLPVFFKHRYVLSLMWIRFAEMNFIG